MMTDEELDAYFATPEHYRDRETFRREQVAKARLILESLPSQTLESRESA